MNNTTNNNTTKKIVFNIHSYYGPKKKKKLYAINVKIAESDSVRMVGTIIIQESDSPIINKMLSVTKQALGELVEINVSKDMKRSNKGRK